MFGGAGFHFVLECVLGEENMKVKCEDGVAYSFGRWYSVSVSWEDLCAAELAIWCKYFGYQGGYFCRWRASREVSGGKTGTEEW